MITIDDPEVTPEVLTKEKIDHAFEKIKAHGDKWAKVYWETLTNKDFKSICAAPIIYYGGLSVVNTPSRFSNRCTTRRGKTLARWRRE